MERTYLPNTRIEVVNPNIQRGRIHHVLFDFDGTLSLIREGWQNVMIPMMVEFLKETGTKESEEELHAVAKEFVTRLTGKQTIYQMIELKNQIEQRGGQAKDPLEYKHIYLARLWERIKDRVKGLKDGTIDPIDMVVPGSYSLLKALKQRGVTMYLASGTDIPYVKDESAAIRVAEYFEPHIYGALDDYKSFSKKLIIQKILQENHLSGPELLTFGDGFVEIEDTKAVGGIAVGVASDEVGKVEVDEWKRSRLIQAGADLIIPHYEEAEILVPYLFNEI
ncbi:MAG TPA: HAD hydrolase-like protein [bacterium]|nr:HAD hydrolase-like protein [Candidatus Omnitrophota bacterium]HOJ59906.1 HAD hydrolase-like protein [bacterium]HOL95054.1 HAD hydrolase-like protein [bacterium]HPP01959.1 HAD hydrolase-like protein [bacterium]HXK95324.1 HAD hydrolase-like protein [bacterium]